MESNYWSIVRREADALIKEFSDRDLYGLAAMRERSKGAFKGDAHIAYGVAEELRRRARCAQLGSTK